MGQSGHRKSQNLKSKMGFVAAPVALSSTLASSKAPSVSMQIVCIKTAKSQRSRIPRNTTTSAFVGGCAPFHPSPSTASRCRNAASLQMASSSYNFATYAGSDKDMKLAQGPKKRIAIVVEPTPFTHVSGYSNRFKTLLKWLRQAGDEVLVITPDNSSDAPEEFEGAKIINISGFTFPLYKHITMSFGINNGVYTALKDFQPDIVHVSTPGLLVFSTMLYCRLLRLPVLFSYHTHLPVYAKSYGLGFLEWLAWWFIRFVHNRADATLATSPQLCNELCQNGVERVGLWRKGVDTDVFSPQFRSEKMRNEMSDGHPEDPLLVYVGRLGAEKNLSMLVPILDQIPNSRLCVVGNGPIRESLQAEFGSRKVKFLGQRTGVELSQAFASADLFVMPSESETLGFVVMESMASGVPVVGARAGGIPDLIHDGKNGLMFEPGNVDEAVRCIRSVLDNRDKYAAMAKEARTEAERWNWEAATAVTRNLHYPRAMNNFRFRILGGFGLPRSLTWLRWIRRRFVSFANFVKGLFAPRRALD